MKSRLNWRPEEDKMLKQLRDDHKLKSWNQIATRLSVKFSYSNRSAKQCRERYCNTARFSSQTEDRKPWTKEEDRILCQLYIQHGPNWTSFLNIFPTKSQNSIKNRFYSCLRKASRKFIELQNKQRIKGQILINTDLILTFLKLSWMIYESQQNFVEFGPIQNLSLIKLRKQLLEIMFQCRQFAQIELYQTFKQFHEINIQIRCLGIFRKKNREQWTWNQSRYKFIKNFEKQLRLKEARQTAKTSTQIKVNQNQITPVTQANQDQPPQNKTPSSVVEELSNSFKLQQSSLFIINVEQIEL